MIDDDFSEHRPRRERDAQTPSKWLPPEEYVEDEVNPNEGLPFARKWRMAVLGGSFDPVHLGHIRLARKVQEQDWADEVLFVPAKRSPFKGEAMMDTGRRRMEMLDLAIQDALAEKPAFSRLRPDGSTEEREYRLGVSDLELQRPGKFSYTYDTLSLLRRVYPDVRILFLMGTDCLQDLKKWHNAGGLLKDFDFLIYPRAGVPAPNPVELVRSYGVLGAQLVRSILPPEGLPVWDISSTEVRKKIAGGEALADFLTPSVQKYVLDHKLYQEA